MQYALIDLFLIVILLKFKMLIYYINILSIRRILIMKEKSNNSSFSFKMEEGFDFVLQEGQNTSTNLRKIAWGDSSEAKIDIRKWRSVPDLCLILRERCEVREAATTTERNVVECSDVVGKVFADGKAIG